MNLLVRSALALWALCLPATAAASLSIFEHGNGIKAMGMAGIGYTVAEETTAIAANPARTGLLGHRYDIGVDMFTIKARGRYRGNAAGPDALFRNDGRKYFAIPQGGYARPLSDRWAFGVTVLSAGLGPDYHPDSPYARFGGPPRAALQLAQLGVVAAFSYRLGDRHRLGLSLNPGYQSLRLEGIQSFATLSQQPDKVTNQGKDGRFGIGYTLGWHSEPVDGLQLGAAYRSKTYTERHEDYAGLLPDRGRLELPAFYGAAVAWTGIPRITLAFEFQRYEHASEPAFGNSISRLAQGQPLGSARGPGFGHEDQNVYKMGLDWQATPRLLPRAGLIRATRIMQPGETLFNFLAPVNPTTHYTAGLTYGWGEHELTVMAFHTPAQRVRGAGSIPPDLGGGEADVSSEGTGFGLSVGRRF